MRKIWSDEAWEDYTYWQEYDKKKIKKINRLIKSIDRNGYDCEGHAEPLKEDLSGFYIHVVYTGALDELFDFRFGRLPYRSLRFDWKHEDIDSFQEAPVVAYPQEPGFTRITEYKKLPVQDVRGTTYAIEYPLPYVRGKDNEPFYPILTKESQEQYSDYKKLADKIENLVCCGRLANYKYYNMDEAISMAIETAENELQRLRK